MTKPVARILKYLVHQALGAVLRCVELEPRLQVKGWGTFLLEFHRVRWLQMCDYMSHTNRDPCFDGCCDNS